MIGCTTAADKQVIGGSLHIRMPRRPQIFWIFLVTGALLSAAATAEAQWRARHRYTTQNEPPNTEVIVARWHFGANGMFGGNGWSHNYPNSDRNLNQYVKETTGIDIDRMSYRIVELGEDDVFEFPFAYVSEPGEMRLTEKEVENLREFVNRGGFVLIDDFDGPIQFAVMRQQVRRALPDHEWLPLEIEHQVFHAHFDLDDLQGMDPYVPGGHVTYYAMYNEVGDVVMVAGYNNDLANFWEWFGQPGMPLRPSADAFRLGVNYMVYALTH